MRTSRDELRDGYVYNGYDYNLQVWVRNGIVQPCGHPRTMAQPCCAAGRLAGRRVAELPDAERRDER